MRVIQLKRYGEEEEENEKRRQQQQIVYQDILAGHIDIYLSIRCCNSTNKNIEMLFEKCQVEQCVEWRERERMANILSNTDNTYVRAYNRLYFSSE